MVAVEEEVGQCPSKGVCEGEVAPCVARVCNRSGSRLPPGPHGDAKAGGELPPHGWRRCTGAVGLGRGGN